MHEIKLINGGVIDVPDSYKLHYYNTYLCIEDRQGNDYMRIPHTSILFIIPSQKKICNTPQYRIPVNSCR